MVAAALAGPSPSSPVQFTLQTVPFQLESDETPDRHQPASMAGGVAVFDYNGDGRPDIFFTNGANIHSLKKDDPKYRNRLFRNDGGGKWTDVTAAAGLAGSGFDIGVAVADYDNDGHPDLFVAGVRHNTLYHNNGDGTFTDVSAAAGLSSGNDPDFGPLWAVAAAWVDINNDGLLDLFVVNYVQWDVDKEAKCEYHGKNYYCHPKFYKGLPNQLFLNEGSGKFKDISKESGIRSHVGKGMGVGVADYDGDGKPDLFVSNDNEYNFLFHNVGEGKFAEVAFDAGVALVESGSFISGMGLDFRDFDNDGWPDIALTALNNETFPLFRNTGKATFEDITVPTGMAKITRPMSSFGAGLYDFDNDGWKDLFITRGHVDTIAVANEDLAQFNTVFHNQDRGQRWIPLTDEAGLAASAKARHRGLAFGDFDGDGRVDVVATALGAPPEIWMNKSPAPAHWIDIKLQGTRSNRDGIGAVVKVTSKSGTQWNQMTTSVGYASSSDGPVHFGLGMDTAVDSVDIQWSSGAKQHLEGVPVDRVITATESK